MARRKYIGEVTCGKSGVTVKRIAKRPCKKTGGKLIRKRRRIAKKAAAKAGIFSF